MDKNDIKIILTDWNYWGSYTDSSIQRPRYTAILERYLKIREIIVCSGVRRSGKSTIITQFLKQYIPSENIKNTLIINFEDPRFRKPTLDLLNSIYEVYQEEVLPDRDHYVVLDEVQEIEGWEKFARFLTEAKKVQVFVTGSSSKLLSGEYATLLTGRHIDLEIFPLSFDEFILFKGITIENEIDAVKKRHLIKNLLHEYIEYGSFPKVTLIEKNDRRILLENYLRDILTKDIQKRYKIREFDKLEELAKYYLTHISTLQPFNKVKNALGISLDTVGRFSHYFTAAGLLFFIRRFSYSKREQILNPKKVYCVDVGIRNTMSFRFNEDLGRLIENIVCVNLVRKGYEVYYFRSKKTNKEVDFVIKGKLKIDELIQVCYTLDDPETKKREITALLEASKELRCDSLRIITYDFDGEEEVNGKKILYSSLWKWLLE